MVLDDRLVERLTTWVPEAGRLPPSVELSVFVAARSRTAVDCGEYLLVVGPNLGAQAAGRGLGRFADLIGPDASEALAEAAGGEAELHAAESGAVVAELVYRPLRARSANVAVRPLVRKYELPVGVAPTVPPHRVVHVDELSVGLQDGRFQVWWDAVDRPLVLTSGHMLNSAAAPAVCRALLDLTSDGRIDLPIFDWGSMAEMPFLPRIRSGRVVLSPAQWRLGTGDLGGSADGFDERLDAWRASGASRPWSTSSAPTTGCCSIWTTPRTEPRPGWLWTAPVIRSSCTRRCPGRATGGCPVRAAALMVELVVPLVRRPAADPAASGGGPTARSRRRGTTPTGGAHRIRLALRRTRGSGPDRGRGAGRPARGPGRRLRRPRRRRRLVLRPVRRPRSATAAAGCTAGRGYWPSGCCPS